MESTIKVANEISYVKLGYRHDYPSFSFFSPSPSDQRDHENHLSRNLHPRQSVGYYFFIDVVLYLVVFIYGVFLLSPQLHSRANPVRICSWDLIKPAMHSCGQIYPQNSKFSISHS